ncbi:hypothetical protein ACFQ3N_07515 [Virgibacillus byunsanensis]|uniref:Uncharacterized protein n=1 Tax=Virgibacillus byunsanensis TaxID=570945 RepID=A0ABW3LKS6_9BACI
MLKKLYYTSEITAASLIGTVIILLFYLFEGIAAHGMEVFTVFTQFIIVIVVYLIVFLIAFFFLINPFYDFLIGKLSTIAATIIIMGIANVILIAGLYVDTSHTVLEVVIEHLMLFIATNISIVYFAMKKSST